MLCHRPKSLRKRLSHSPESLAEAFEALERLSEFHRLTTEAEVSIVDGRAVATVNVWPSTGDATAEPIAAVKVFDRSTESRKRTLEGSAGCLTEALLQAIDAINRSRSTSC